MFLSGRKADSGVDTITTLDAGFSEDGLDGGIELGVDKGERVDGAAEGLQSASMIIRLARYSTTNNFLNDEDDVKYGNGCGFIITSLFTFANSCHLTKALAEQCADQH